MADRAGARQAGRLESHTAPSPYAALRRDAVLCSDGDPAFATFACAKGIAHYAIPAKRGPRVVDGAFHIQTVNQLHAALEDFPRPFNRPATTYLSGYLARQHREAPWPDMLAA